MKINKIFLLALIISLLIHISIFYSLHFFKQKKEKQEEKPIFITLNYEKQKENPKKGIPKRKIPKKTKLKTAKKSSIPKHSFNNIKKNISKKETKEQQTNVKNKEKSKINKKIEKTKPKKIKTQKKATKKVVIRKEKPKEEKKVENKKPKQKDEEKLINKEKNQVKQPNLPFPKTENKNLKIAEKQKTKKEEKKLPKVPIPPAENNKVKEEKPPKQLNISHLKGKNQIFQMGGKKPKKEGITKKDGDIMEYLYYVRDRLQENLAYPLTAKRLEIEGTVIVRFIIKKDGTVDTKEIKIVKSSGSNVLDKQAIITVENSIPFKPPPNNKSIVVEIPVIFEIIRSDEF